MLFKRKIPCYLLIFDQVDIIRKTLAFITRYADKLDIIVIENPSANTRDISDLVEDYAKRGLIKRYYLFHKNITGEAFRVVLEAASEVKTINKSPLIMLTDGDLTSSDKQWLNEEVAILKHHPEVVACGISLDTSNLPIKTFPEAKNWLPPDKHVYEDFYEVCTGAHLLLLRTSMLIGFLQWQKDNGLGFVDSNMHRYCYEIVRKKWGRTKDAKAYHLTWDLYQNKNHSYTKLKTGKSFQDTWHHKQTSDYTLKEY